MKKKIYLSQIQSKINLLQRERKQVVEHLSLIDNKLKKLQETIEIMQEQTEIEKYNTQLYTYRSHKRRFKGKLRQMLLQEMKKQPHHLFSVNELVTLVLIQDEQQPIIQPQHTVSVRGALKHWLNKGIIERVVINSTKIYWRLTQ